MKKYAHIVQEYPDELRWLLTEKYGISRQEAAAVAQKFLTSGDEDTIEMLLRGTTTQAVQTTLVEQDLDALAEGMPVAYLIGWTDFLGCRIDLSLRPLIPRPETEYWVEKCIQEIKAQHNNGQTLNILDLCCGSGCIGVALLKHVPHVNVSFVDIDNNALQQTRTNLALNDVSPEKWQLIESDLFSGVDGRFDLIVSNPPYVSQFGEFSPTVRFEPEKAIFAQDNGFEALEKIILVAQQHLKTEGSLWLEFAADQAERVQELAKNSHWSIRVKQDQFGRDRYAILRYE